MTPAEDRLSLALAYKSCRLFPVRPRVLDVVRANESVEPVASLKDFFRTELLPDGLSYFEYQYSVARDVLIPWLDPHLSLAGLAVGDFGGHQGGVLQGLREIARVDSGVGFVVDEASIRQSPFKPNSQFRLVPRDILDVDATRYRFDLILLRDVLEHTRNPVAILERARTSLTQGGRIFVSFPPYSFGGHQHEASNGIRFVPFIHYLPDALFFSLSRFRDTPYMSAKSTLADVRSVRQTRLTLSKAERAFDRAGLRIETQEFFLFRPEFHIRYGLSSWNIPLVHRVPVVREIATLGAYYLLAPKV
jgi:SAM-dependent methyltransferase